MSRLTVCLLIMVKSSRTTPAQLQVFTGPGGVVLSWGQSVEIGHTLVKDRSRKDAQKKSADSGNAVPNQSVVCVSTHSLEERL